jgi:response regulator RpfG family c-di-GMP phosphodiesterase
VDIAAADEMAVVREHCYLGYKIISRSPFLAQPAKIVYSHHGVWVHFIDLSQTQNFE